MVSTNYYACYSFQGSFQKHEVVSYKEVVYLFVNNVH